jgi:hypothetical protein
MTGKEHFAPLRSFADSEKVHIVMSFVLIYE